MPRHSPRLPTSPRSKVAAAVISQPPGGAAAARRHREAFRRLEKLTWFYVAQQEHGLSRRGAARFIRVPHISLWKYERRIRNGGFAGLVSKRKGPVLSRAVQLGLQPEILSRVQSLAVLRGSVAAAWRAFAHDPLCPAELRAKIQPGCEIPEALRRAVGFQRRVVTVRVRVAIHRLRSSTNAASPMRIVSIRRSNVCVTARESVTWIRIVWGPVGNAPKFTTAPHPLLPAAG